MTDMGPEGNTSFLAIRLLLVFLASAVLDTRSKGADDSETRSCGDVCVQLVAQYYGRPFDLGIVREALRLDEHGACSLDDLEKAFEICGLRAVAVHGDAPAIEQTGCPVIIHVRNGLDQAGGHFAVVIYDGKSGRLVAYDPFYSAVPTPIDRETLARSWSGDALLVRPQSSASTAHLILFSSCGAIVGALLGMLRRT